MLSLQFTSLASRFKSWHMRRVTSLKGKESKISLGGGLGLFEKKLKARRVKFFIIVSPADCAGRPLHVEESLRQARGGRQIQGVFYPQSRHALLVRDRVGGRVDSGIGVRR